MAQHSGHEPELNRKELMQGRKEGMSSAIFMIAPEMLLTKLKLFVSLTRDTA